MRLARSRMFGPVMRFLGSIAAVALLASTGAQAADAFIPTKAPPFVAAYNWSGLYVGGHLGAGFILSQLDAQRRLPRGSGRRRHARRPDRIQLPGWKMGSGSRRR